jgi:putative protease
MIESGVMSFKIEGRMKQLEYATGVVSVYRHYIDQYLYKGAKNYSVSDEDIEKLLSFGNRSGFTDVYMHHHNGHDMITFEAPSHTKSDKMATAIPGKKIKVDCKVTVLLGKEFKVSFTDELGNVGECVSNVVERAQNRSATKEDIEKAVSGLGNTEFELGKLNIEYDDGIFLPVSVIKNARREAIASLTNQLLGSNEKEVLPYSKLSKRSNISQAPRCFVSVTSMEQLKEVSAHRFVDAIGVPVNMFEDALKSFKGEIYICLPPILRAEYIDKMVIDDRAAGVIASSFDELGILLEKGYPVDKIILDSRLYTFNNRSIEGFENLDIKKNCIPYELSLKELKHRYNGDSQMIIYSRIPMMVTANCTVKNTKGCTKCNERITIVDRKNESMMVQCNCDYCYNTIYNSKKYLAFDLKDELLNLGVREFRLDFTVESAAETSEILKAYEEVFINNTPCRLDIDYTRGHLKRGVE